MGLLDHDRQWSTRCCRAAPERNFENNTDHKKPTNYRNVCAKNMQNQERWLRLWGASMKGQLVAAMSVTWHETKEMNGWMNDWMTEWLDEWMNEWMIEWMNEWKSEWMNEWKSEWMDERMNAWTNGWANQSMNQAIEESTKQWTNESIKSNQVGSGQNQIKSKTKSSQPNQIKSVQFNSFQIDSNQLSSIQSN